MLCGSVDLRRRRRDSVCFCKWNKIDTQEIKADDLIINEEVKQNKDVDLGDGYTNVALFGVEFQRWKPWQRKPYRLYYSCQSQ